ncbi:hypothetical protein RMATCC62417_08614 [Rhizopus microsporus]|nr:hypothetical protein RMATCC62417_08614 [Rhizopus microsporus]
MSRSVDSKEESHAQEKYQESIRYVMDNANKIQLDHYIYYFTRYEEARMMVMQENYEAAQDIVKSIIKASEKGQFNVGAGPHAKNKYSLESALLFKCHNCLTEIELLMSNSANTETAGTSSSSSSFVSANDKQ